MGLEGKATNFGMWEALKKRAISEWNGQEYKKACDVLGIEPEFNDLYQRGAADEQHHHEQKERSKRITPYSNFYRKASVLHDYDTDSQKNILIACFPKRFGEKGVQPIANWEDSHIQYLFKKIVKYSEKIIGKHN
jgi:hypothetical protein